MKTALYALVAIPAISLSAPKCSEGNALPAEQRDIAAALGAEWLSHARYCDFGTYQVLLSTDPKSDEIFVFRAKRPFVSYDHGSINLMQDYPKKKSVPFLSVQDWDKSGVFRRLDYTLFDKSGNIIGNAQDKEMTGLLTITKYTQTPPKKPYHAIWLCRCS